MESKHTNQEIGQSVARNISVMFAAQVVTWGSSFVLLYYLPRYLGSEDFGRLYLALSIKMMLSLLIDFGGNYLIPKEVARSEKAGLNVLSSYIILRILLWALSIGIILLMSDLLGYSEHVHILILILAIGKLWEGGSSALSAYYQGIERMEYPSIGSIVEKVLVAAFAVVALLMGGDSIQIAIIFTAGALINLVVLIWFSRKTVRVSYKVDLKMFSLLSSGMPYFLFSLFSVIYYRIDAVMISAITTETVTGWYGGAYRFFDIVMVLPLLYKTAIFPVFSKLWNNKQGVLENTVSESMRLMILLGIPTAILICVYAEPIIHFFMGLEEYGPSVIILQIFAISIPIIYIDIILGSAIMGAANRQKAWAVVGFVAIFVNIGINFLLIPYTQAAFANGGIGAATATLFTEVFVMVCALFLIPSSYLKPFKRAYLFKPVAASLVMVAIVVFMVKMNVYWMLAAAIAIIVYTGALFLFKTFNRDEKILIRNVLSVDQFKMMISWKD